LSDQNKTERLEVGKIYKAKVIRPTKTMGGESIAMIDDFTVCVSGERVDEGQEIRVKITDVRGKDATANLVTNAADIF
jgi:predicted RNA-binding protein with TRAM domain